MDRRFIGILIWLSILLVGMAPARSQSSDRKVRLGLFGYLVLPREYRAYRTEDLRDAWYGYIAPPDNKVRINWSSGLVQTPFQNGEGKFVWVKRETVAKSLLTYGVRHTKEGDVVDASVGGVNLHMTLKSDGDIDLFLKIARSFRREQCDDCERPLPAPPSNKSLDASGGSVFRIMTGPALLE